MAEPSGCIEDRSNLNKKEVKPNDDFSKLDKFVPIGDNPSEKIAKIIANWEKQAVKQIVSKSQLPTQTK